MGQILIFPPRYDTTEVMTGSDADIALKQLHHPSKIVEGPLVNHIIRYAHYKFGNEDLKEWQTLLEEYHFDPNVVDEKRNTPLHYAAMESIKNNEFNKMIPFLTKIGANCHHKNIEGLYPLSNYQQNSKEWFEKAF